MGGGLGNGLHLQSPTGIDVDRLGNVYVVNHKNSRIAKFTAKGEFIVNVAKGIGNVATRFKEPHDVAVDREGTVFITDSANNRIQIFYLSGEVAAAYSSTIRVIGNRSFQGLKRSTRVSDNRTNYPQNKKRKKQTRGIEK